jgi:hypothetical protein
VTRHFGIPKPHNPEAPTDGLEDHRHEPPHQQPKWWWWIGVGLLVGVAFILLLEAANAHLPDRPDLNTWAMGLQNGRGTLCCEFKEAEGVLDANWDTTVRDGIAHYRVNYHGEWIEVEDDSIVRVPNLYGVPLVWISYLDGKPWVRCFLPGAGG